MGDLYSMKLHETIIINNGGVHIAIIRVPGGWVYRSGTDMCFVPYNNEFQSN